MFDNELLSIAIGLVFVFVLYSLLATILLEIISGIINLRAVMLVRAITVMLNDRQKLDLSGKNQFQKLWIRVSVYVSGWFRSLACRFPKNTFAYVFFSHPSIKYLSKSSLRSKPSYIEPANFSATIIKILRGAHYDGSKPQIEQIRLALYPDNSHTAKVSVGLLAADSAEGVIKQETLDQLRQLFVDAQNDTDRFKGLLEDWFNEVMARTTGWYKRKTNGILFTLGLIIAIWGNVDTLKIYRVVASDKTAREQLVNMAASSVPKLKGVADSHEEISTEAYSQVSTAINQSGLVLGIGTATAEDSAKLKALNGDAAKLGSYLIGYNKTYNKKTDSLDTIIKKLPGPAAQAASNQLKILQQVYNTEASARQKQLDALKNSAAAQQKLVALKQRECASFVGWLITALAISLGSPFWFDILSKIINLRSAGQKPDAPSPKPPTDIVKANISPNQRIG